MTIIDPTDPASYEVSYADVTADWLDQLVPLAIRESGAELLRELQDLRQQIIPLLPRVQALMDWQEHATNRASKIVRDLAGQEAEQRVSDGLYGIVNVLSHNGDIFVLLAGLGIDPDDLENAAKELGEVQG